MHKCKCNHIFSYWKVRGQALFDQALRNDYRSPTGHEKWFQKVPSFSDDVRSECISECLLWVTSHTHPSKSHHIHVRDYSYYWKHSHCLGSLNFLFLWHRDAPRLGSHHMFENFNKGLPLHNGMTFVSVDDKGVLGTIKLCQTKGFEYFQTALLLTYCKNSCTLVIA